MSQMSSLLTSPRESPVRRTMGANLFFAVGLGLKIGSSILIIPLALKYLGKGEYGLWIVLQSVATFLSWSEMGLGQSILNFQNIAFVRDDYSEINRILTTGFGVYCSVIIPVWIAFTWVIFTKPVAAWLLKDGATSIPGHFTLYIFLTGTLALLRVPGTAFPSTLLGLRETSLRQLIDCAMGALVLAGTVLALVAGGKLLALILVTNLIPLAVCALNYPLIVMRYSQVRLAKRFWTPAYFWTLISNSFFFLLYGLGLLFQRTAGNLLAAKFVPLEQVTQIFVLLMVLRMVGWPLADIVSRTLQPYVIMYAVQQRRDRVLFFAKLCTKFTFGAGVIYCAMVWLFADVGIKWWLGREFFLGYGPLAFLMGSFLVELLFLPANNFMVALNQHKLLAITIVGYSLLTLGLGVVGAARWKPAAPLYGLCIGFFAASVIGQGLVQPWLANGWLKVKWGYYFREFLLKPGLIAGCGAAMLMVVMRAGITHVMQRGLAAVVVLAISALVGWFFVFDSEERQWIGCLIFERILVREGATVA